MCQGKAKAKRVRRHINRMQDHYHSEKVTCRKCDGGRYKGIARGTESMDKHWQTSAEETPDSDPSPGPQRKRGEIKDVCRACGATSHTITKHVSKAKMWPAANEQAKTLETKGRQYASNRRETSNWAAGTRLPPQRPIPGNTGTSLSVKR